MYLLNLNIEILINLIFYIIKTTSRQKFNTNLQIYVNKNEILLSSLTPQLIQIKSANPKVKVHLRGDARLNYGAIAVVAGEIRNAGIQVIALRTDMATLKNEIEAFPLDLIKPKPSKNGG